MNDDIRDLYRQAGEIGAWVLREGARLIRPDAGIRETVEAIEGMIDDRGAQMAFPINVSLNEAAAHDTASRDDERRFAPGDLVKLDIGVHLEGYIADTATTIDLGENASLVAASQEALDAAIAAVRPGVTAGELGGVIQEAIALRGFRPVANLTGHGLDQYDLHTVPTIPNIGMAGGAVIEEGMAFAIEPFATTGSGHVSESPRVEIFQQLAVRPVRLRTARRVLDVSRQVHGLPFCRRWIDDARADLAIKNMVQSGILRPYPVLHDIPGSLVSQAEHTVIVTGDGCEVTTR
ncbi:MAG: type II methionyl aminopeptidase [Methanomicrobiales archaeon]